MGNITTKISASIEVDSTGAVWLKRFQEIWNGETRIATSPPHRQQIEPGSETGVDAFSDTGGVPALCPLDELAGDRWPDLQAIMSAKPQ